ncbi:7209_t:CDS:2 [Acaulospora morrowiae]|uniref:7209_t:CDS:1 n=1 Tax=Acaulospora morrowiae TaxID=94023 RepID=A0A9N9AR79_9GLOM|nr:7209_t:CDS:2 [Acaulospora morrowiae]
MDYKIDGHGTIVLDDDEELKVAERVPVKEEFEIKAIKRELKCIEIKDEDDNRKFLRSTTARSIAPRRNRAPVPYMNTQDWTEAEDHALLSGIQTHGGKWSIICREIDTGRTPIQCFRRWNKMVRCIQRRVAIR